MKSIISEVDLVEMSIVAKLAEECIKWLSTEIHINDIEYSMKESDMYRFSSKGFSDFLRSSEYRNKELFKYMIAADPKIEFSSLVNEEEFAISSSGKMSMKNDQFYFIIHSNSNKYFGFNNQEQFYLFLKKHLYGTILHEFDHFSKIVKSHGRIAHTKDTMKVLAKNYDNKFSTYVNSLIEVEAYFTDAVAKIDMDGREFKDVFEDFKFFFGKTSAGSAWKMLRDGNKKKLIRDLYKVWKQENTTELIGEDVEVSDGKTHYNFSSGKAAIETEMHDAQGENQQTLSWNEKDSLLFGDKKPRIFNILDVVSEERIKDIEKMLEFDKKKIESYAKKMREGKKFPPCTVWFNSDSSYSKYSLISGRHRLLASIMNGYTQIPCLVMFWRDRDEEA